jgi:hypothetical protein
MFIRSAIAILGLLALIAFPVQAGATTTDECQAQITSLRADAAGTAFVNAKDQAGLLAKLDAASAALTAGKNADAIRKLTDFGTKVQALGSTGKLGTEDADRLARAASEAIGCIESTGV